MKPLLPLLALLCTLPAFAQQEIRGRVLYEQSREPVVGANVTLHPAGETAILAFGITDTDGNFVLRRAQMPDSVTVQVRAMTIGTQSKTVRSNIGFVEFLVAAEVTELQEVTVQAPRIRQVGDTLNFNVASFLQETDRSIGDVLRRLPGVQVLSTGEILYQNRPISRFYIEGLDLLRGRYGLATQNIDARNVATVQILENHQPIRALQGTEIPEAAAINLRLQQSALGAFFATAQAGAGLPAVLLSNELVGMRFTHTQQNLITYKGDNTGRDIAQELVAFYGGTRDATMRFLNVTSPSPPAIGRQHFLFNDAHLASINDLRTLTQDLTLTTNLNYLFDRHRRNGYSRRDIFIDGDENIIIAEDISSRLLSRELEGSITLESNTDDRFLNNRFNISARWNEESGEVQTNELISQHLNLPSFHIANTFEHVRRVDNRRQRSGISAAYTRQHNVLSVTPVLFEDLGSVESPLQQDILFNHLRADAFTNRHRHFERLNFGLHYRIGATFNHHSLQSDLFSGADRQPFIADSLRNDVHRNQASINFSTGLNREFFQRRFNAQLLLPIQYVFLERNDRIRASKQSRSYLLYSPSLIIQGTLNPRLTLRTNIDFSNHIGGFMEDFQGYMMTSYRTMNRNEDLQNESRTGRASVRFSYRNPFTTLFASMGLFYSYTWRNALPSVHYNGILSSVTSIRHPNTSDNYGVNFTFGQNIDFLRSEIRIDGGYSRNNSIALNQGVILPFSSDSYRISPSINSSIGHFLMVRYSARYSQNRVTISNNRLRDPIHNLTQNIGASIIPMRGLIFNIGINHYYNNVIQSSARSSWFGNTGVRYRAGRTEWMLDWTNMFNTRRFVTYSHSDVSSFYSEYHLRPAEILLRVRFTIL
jgi:hypothetical protein